MKKQRMLQRYGALAAAVVTLLLGCSGKPPVIARSYARVIYVDDVSHDAKSETLGVYLVASDPDGMENLSAFYVIDDDAELFWKVDKTAWESSTAEGESWIGASTLSMPGDSPLPSGVYRVVLQNVGGDTVEDTITVPERSVSALQASYPTVTVQDGIAAGADCTISASEETFIRLLDRKLGVMSAYLSGKLKLSGDLGAAMQLSKLLS